MLRRVCTTSIQLGVRRHQLLSSSHKIQQLRATIITKHQNQISRRIHMGNIAMSSNNNKYPAPAVMGDESIMSKKAHGTSAVPVQENLRWKVDQDTADRICNFNRHYAEHSGYFQSVGDFLKEAKNLPATDEITFYDSNTGKPLFHAPRGRTMDEFLKESRNHGWPSFRDQETNWDNVRVLSNGETVSIDGTHLGHNLPDGKGSRYCINLVCVAGRPTDGKEL